MQLLSLKKSLRYADMRIRSEKSCFGAEAILRNGFVDLYRNQFVGSKTKASFSVLSTILSGGFLTGD